MEFVNREWEELIKLKSFSLLKRIIKLQFPERCFLFGAQIRGGKSVLWN